MNKLKNLPVGVDNFEKIRTYDYYYVDKTKLIEQLFQNCGEVNLFTRPRRFGKTLNMSMLKYFFEIGTNPSLFDGLYISSNKELCEKHLGQYPVIFLTLKSVDGLNYEEAKNQMMYLIGSEASRFKFLKDSRNLEDEDKAIYQSLIRINDNLYNMNDSVLVNSLQILSKLLYKHFGKKVVILIDEYDVPLDKAFSNGYYKEMVSLMRGIFGNALKTNDNLEFAVLTGCLRVSKESIFTGLNNFMILSIVDQELDEQFGFTEEDVKNILKDYRAEDKFKKVKEWYDGYHFGNADIYCPWDVIYYVNKLKNNSDIEPQSFWVNTSGNDLIRRFIDKANNSTRNEIDRLINGESIDKFLRLDLTYDEIDNSIENIWSVLFTTGYLTHCGINNDGSYKLIIPNKEIKQIYENQIKEWFKEDIRSNTAKFQELYHSFEIADTQKIETTLNIVLNRSMSVFDAEGNDIEKENAYHNFLSGILTGNDDWSAQSNLESGEGRADIIIEKQDLTLGIVIELKYVKEKVDMEEACDKALDQIKEKRYTQYLLNKDITNILIYGITFCKKKCKLKVEKLNG